MSNTAKLIIVNTTEVLFDSISFLGQGAQPIPPQLKFTITGTSVKTKVSGQTACLTGDEKSVVLNINYKTAAHNAPGAGTLTIEDQSVELTSISKIGGKEIIVAGAGKFKAIFTIGAKALDPATGTPDAILQYKGEGVFIPKVNTKVFAE